MKNGKAILACVVVWIATGCSDDSNPPMDPGIQPAAIAGTAWHDLNADGVQGASETDGVPGITIALQECALRQLDATATDNDGNYQFSSLPESDYNIQVDNATYLISPRHQGTNESRDSDVDASTGSSSCFTLRADDIRDTVDIGLFKTGTVRGAVWLDANADGIRDPGETGEAGQRIELRDADGNLLDSATTDANGEYAFADLMPASYLIEVPITTFVFSPQDVGFDDTVDSDVDPATGRSAPTVLESEGTVFVDAGVHI